MIITNNHNLPESIYRAIVNDDYVKVGDYSATSIIKPPQMLALERRYADKITQDASDMLWMLLGKAMHHVLETGNHANSIIEARLQVNFGDIVVSAKPDLYEIADKSIDDYKCTSVWSFLLGDKEEWDHQLNINAYIYQANGFPVELLRIYAILRDHIKGKAKADPNYPAIPFITKELNLWPDVTTRSYIMSRIALHEEAKDTPDELLTPCTDKERWIRDDSWAVIKQGNKKATKVFNTEQEAEEFAKTDSKFSVQCRKSEPVRCNNYCNASPFCKQIAGIQEVAE